MAGSKPEILGITPGMEKYKEMTEDKKPEKAEFKPKSFEELKQSGDKRLEAGRDKVFNFKQGIKDKFIGIWGKMKGVRGVSREILKTVAASPEIVKYGKDLVEYKSGQAYEAVADKVESSLNSAGEFVSEKCRGAIDNAKARYNKLGDRAVDAYVKFENNVQSIQESLREKLEQKRKERDFQELLVARENLFEMINTYNNLLIRNMGKWGIDESKLSELRLKVQTIQG